MARSLDDRLAFCSWSTQPAGIDALIENVNAIGIRNLHLAIDPLIAGGDNWRDTPQKLADHGIRIASGMFGAVGEDYSTIARIHETGGVLPDDTWPQTWANFQQMIPLAAEMGITLVTLHAGFLPETHTDPVFAKVAQRLQQTCALAAEHGLTVGLETGQESAPTLEAALDRIGSTNLGVNFDPANMILYGSGDPTAALVKLMPRVVQVHIKDATPSGNPGTDWGEEAVVGTGRVNWPAFFEVLDNNGYDGCYAIEREAGDQRIADIKAARAFLEQTLA